jgi:bifunctional oligoribonuclease and PAP phosphatase NrnA
MVQNNFFNEINEKLKEADNILMTLHKGPDGDSLGSCGVMKYYLEKLGKKVKLIGYDKPSEDISDFDFVNEIEFGKKLEDFDLKNFDVVLLLDSGAPSQAKTSEDVLEKGFVINMDHHGTNPFYGNLNYVDSLKCSTCSVLLDFFEELGIEIDEEIASRLLIGVYSDSGGFVNRNALGALEDAQRLLKKGANYLEIVEKLNSISLRMKKYNAYLVNNLETRKNIGWTYLSEEKVREFGLNLSEVRQGIRELRNIRELDIVFTISEVEEGMKISFRSSGDIDVSLFANELGGGGHKGAASASLKDISMEEAKDKVLEVIDRVIDK